mgnify:CR=1 FL=1|jgi:hypothetical protein
MSTTDTKPPVFERIHETVQPYDLSDELQSTVEKLDLVDTVKQVEEEGYSYLHDVAPVEFNDRLRQTIMNIADGRPGCSMLLDKDPIFAEVVLNPKILAIVEILCGKGAMVSQIAASIRPQGAPAMGLHADQNWFPAPFPVHNQLVTFCWACDAHTKEAGATKVIPRTHELRRHPTPEEVEEFKGAIATECPAGSVPFWDGSVWHSNWPRTLEGERVVLHITFSRLALRPVESYDHLDEDWLADKPEKMREILGRCDFLNKTGGAYSHGAETMARTMNWAKT